MNSSLKFINRKIFHRLIILVRDLIKFIREYPILNYMFESWLSSIWSYTFVKFFWYLTPRKFHAIRWLSRYRKFPKDLPAFLLESGFSGQPSFVAREDYPLMVRWAFVFLHSIEFLLPLFPSEFPLEQLRSPFCGSLPFSWRRVQTLERHGISLSSLPSHFWLRLLPETSFCRNLSKRFAIVNH